MTVMNLDLVINNLDSTQIEKQIPSNRLSDCQLRWLKKYNLRNLCKKS